MAYSHPPFLVSFTREYAYIQNIAGKDAMSAMNDTTEKFDTEAGSSPSPSPSIATEEVGTSQLLTGRKLVTVFV